MHFPDVILNDVATWNVLKNDGRKSEVELQRWHYRQILPIILVYEGVRTALQRQPGLANHLPADIHAMHFAKLIGQRPRHPSGPAPDFEHPHVATGFSLANILQIGEDFLGYGLLA